MIRSVAVYCSSSDAIAGSHVDRAKALGRIIGEHGWELVFGGASVGLMGHLAREAKASGAAVYGVVPEFLVARGVAEEVCDEVLVTETMSERKARIAERADALIALPGSIGTMEELLEQMALKGLRQHSKPIVLVNAAGYWSPLLELLDRMVEERFLKPELLGVLTVVESVEEIPGALQAYEPPKLPNKWFSAEETGADK